MNPPRKLVISVIVTGIGIGLFSLHCSNKSNPVSSSPTIEPDTTATIGASGGTLTYGDFSLTVPPGAFTGDNDIGVAVDTDFDEVSDGSVTDGYHILDLPRDFSIPLRLRLKYSGDISGDPLVSLSASADDPATGAPCWYHIMTAARDSNGYLVAQIPAILMPGINKAATPVHTDNGSLTVQGQGDYKRKWGYGNQYTYPASFTGSIDDVIQVLENNLHYVQTDLGFGFVSQDVERLNLAEFVTFGFHTSVSQSYAGVVHIGGQACPAVVMPDGLLIPSANNYLINLASGPLLLWLYMVENLAEIKTNYLDLSPAENTWFPMAVKMWSELIFSDGIREIPNGFSGYEIEAMHGLGAAASAMGRTPLIEFLTRQSYYGKEGLQKTVQKIRETQNTARAIVETVDADVPATTWLPEYYRAYLSGEIFNVSGAVFLDSDNITRTWNVNSQKDTLKTLSAAYPDLSAHCYLVNINYADIGENAELVIDADGPPIAHDYGITVQVYADQGGTLEFLGAQDANQANPTITSLKANRDGGVSRYLIAVVYSDHHEDYTGLTDIDLTLHITKNEQRQVVYNTCNLSTGFIFDIEKYTPGGNPEYRTYTNSNTSRGGTCTVTLDGATYHGTSFKDYGNVTTSNEIHVTLSDDLNHVLSLDWTYQETEKDINRVIDIHLVAENIPLFEYIDEVNYAQYKVLGNAVLAAIKEFSYHSSGDLGTETLLGDVRVDGTSVIRINFGKE